MPVARVAALFVVCVAACSSSSSGSGLNAAGIPTTVTCTKNRNTGLCSCRVGSATPTSDTTVVPDCDDAPAGALVCAQITNGEAESCYYQTAQCGKVNRNYTSCECAYNDSGLASSPVTTCTAKLCCDFGEKCSCTDLTGSSIQNTQFDRQCTYFGSGRVVSSCTADAPVGKCFSGHSPVSTCKGLKWKAPSSGGGGGSSSGSCGGCHADSDCGRCERCDLSSCTCLARAVCR